MLCGYATNLKPGDLEAISELEEELGTQLLAVSCQDVRAAQLETGQLGKVRELESKLGVYLVAV